MLHRSLVLLLLIERGWMKTLEAPPTNAHHSIHPPSLCIFNWDEFNLPERKEIQVLTLYQDCAHKRRSIIMKHNPDTRQLLVSDKIWGLGRIHSINKWQPYELQPTSSIFEDSNEQETATKEHSSEKDQLEFTMDFKAGLGVDVYILDTGINFSHKEFGGRARPGKNFVKDEADDDLNGHGTHVAGIIGSSSFGVAKEANLISVKILNKMKQGEPRDLHSAINWVIASSRKWGRPSIIHLSATVLPNDKIDQAVERAARQGIAVIVAGGNDVKDACKFTPGRSKYALTISGINSQDQRSENMARGECVDLHAPGENILSTYIGSDTAQAYMSGTSMAAPYVTGIAASVLSNGFDMGHCHPSHPNTSGQSEACASALYNLLKRSSDVVGELRIARLPDYTIMD